VGKHPADSEPVLLFDGRYGPYVKHGELNASLPKGADPATFSIEEAVRLIEERGKAPKGKGGRSRRPSTGASRTVKKAAKKKAAKKGSRLRQTLDSARPRGTATEPSE
jgi:DNA topoisomerase-1